MLKKLFLVLFIVAIQSVVVKAQPDIMSAGCTVTIGSRGMTYPPGWAWHQVTLLDIEDTRAGNQHFNVRASLDAGLPGSLNWNVVVHLNGSVVYSALIKSTTPDQQICVFDVAVGDVITFDISLDLGPYLSSPAADSEDGQTADRVYNGRIYIGPS